MMSVIRASTSGSMESLRWYLRIPLIAHIGLCFRFFQYGCCHAPMIEAHMGAGNLRWMIEKFAVSERCVARVDTEQFAYLFSKISNPEELSSTFEFGDA